jgi:hypothetical protein
LPQNLHPRRPIAGSLTGGNSGRIHQTSLLRFIRLSHGLKQLVLLGRIAAVMSLLVVCAAKVGHQHDLTGNCCSQEHSHEQTVSNCPFGCAHHGSELPADESESSTPCPSDDGQSCFVCSVLAQAPTVPALLTLPDLTELVVRVIPVSIPQPDTQLPRTCETRGPPLFVSTSAV